MFIHQLQRNETIRRREFPISADTAFLAHAGVCPLPRCVTQAMNDYLVLCNHGDQEAVFPRGLLTRTRQLAAQLMGCSIEEIALVGPTSIGLSMVAHGLDWQPGDNVIIYPDDFPSNVAIWRSLADQGVEIREIQASQLGYVSGKEFFPLMDAKTRLVALSSAHYLSGIQLQIPEIGEAVHARGALFCVDGIQTLGAFPVHVKHVDFFSADAHKWLLGPCSVGIFYVRREVQHQLRPTLLGWNNVHCPHYIAPTILEFPSHAGRYEAGTPNLVGIAGLHAALELLLKVGPHRIQDTLIEHTSFLQDELRRRNFQVEGLPDRRISGITSFSDPLRDIPTLHKKLEEARILTSLRETRDRVPWIRLSPHFYNTRSELEYFLDTLDFLSAGKLET